MVRDSIVQWQKLMGISGDADITEYKKGSCCDTSSIEMKISLTLIIRRGFFFSPPKFRTPTPLSSGLK